MDERSLLEMAQELAKHHAREKQHAAFNQLMKGFRSGEALMGYPDVSGVFQGGNGPNIRQEQFDTQYGMPPAWAKDPSGWDARMFSNQDRAYNPWEDRSLIENNPSMFNYVQPYLRKNSLEWTEI